MSADGEQAIMSEVNSALVAGSSSCEAEAIAGRPLCSRRKTGEKHGRSKAWISAARLRRRRLIRGGQSDGVVSVLRSRANIGSRKRP
jgi:hypothetical protein